MLEKPRRPPNRLARVIEDVVEPWQPLEQKSGEDLNTRRMAQIQPVNLQPLAELREVGLLGVSLRRIDREASGDDYVRSRPEQLQRCLKPDLDARSCDQRVVTTEIGRLLALRIVEVAAGSAHRVVVAMRSGEGLFADVAGALLVQLGAVLEVFRFRGLEPQWGINFRPALNAQARLFNDLTVALFCSFALGASERLRHSHEIVSLGLRDQAGEGEELATLLSSEAGEVRTVGLDCPQNAHACGHVIFGKCSFGGRVSLVHDTIV